LEGKKKNMISGPTWKTKGHLQQMLEKFQRKQNLQGSKTQLGGLGLSKEGQPFTRSGWGKKMAVSCAIYRKNRRVGRADGVLLLCPRGITRTTDSKTSWPGSKRGWAGRKNPVDRPGAKGPFGKGKSKREAGQKGGWKGGIAA